MGRFFKTFTGIVGDGLRSWQPKNMDEVLQRLVASLPKAQVTGFSFGPFRVFYVYDGPPTGGQDRVNSILLYPGPGANDIRLVNAMTLLGGGQKFSMDQSQLKLVTNDLPKRMSGLGVWLSGIEMPDAITIDEFKALLGIPPARMNYRTSVGADSHFLWFGDGTRLSSGSLQTNHIVLLHRDTLFAIGRNNLPGGGHLARLESDFASAYHETLRGGETAGGTKTKQCTKCGTNANADARFCPRCGAEMGVGYPSLRREEI